MPGARAARMVMIVVALVVVAGLMAGMMAGAGNVAPN